MKKLLTAAFSALTVIAMAVTLAACTESKPVNPNEGDKPNDNPPSGETVVDTTISDASLKVDLNGHKLYVTSLGQAADFDTMKNLLTRSMGYAESDFIANSSLTAESVAAGDTVIIVPGASDKGMGAAGINAATEIARANAFAAKKAEINLIVVQLGGSARRGVNSDAIYEVICPAGKVDLIVSSADNDKKFSTTWCANVPTYYYSRGSKMVDSLKFILGK